MAGARASTFDLAGGAAAPSSLRRPQSRRFGSGGAVLLLALCQLACGVVLLGLFEGYKVLRIKFFGELIRQAEAAAADAAGKAAPGGGAGGGAGAGQAWDQVAALHAQSAITLQNPMAIVWWLAIIANSFALCGLAGVLAAQRELVLAYFAFCAVSTVAGAHFFVDIAVDTTVRFGGEPPGLTGYEKAAAFFLLLLVVLSALATGALAVERGEGCVGLRAGQRSLFCCQNLFVSRPRLARNQHPPLRATNTTHSPHVPPNDTQAHLSQKTSTAVALRALDEIRGKRRDEYAALSSLAAGAPGEALQFELDGGGRL
jgi:hypothetical protein